MAMRQQKKGYCAKVDQVDENTVYRGYPEGGTTSEKQSTWAIEKTVRDTATGVWTTLWAQGSDDTRFRWTDRTVLVYSFLK